MPEEINPDWLVGWQRDYDKAVGEGGKVLDVYPKQGRGGGVAIIVKVDEGGQEIFYVPYYNQMANETLYLEGDPGAYPPDPEEELAGGISEYDAVGGGPGCLDRVNDWSYGLGRLGLAGVR